MKGDTAYAISPLFIVKRLMRFDSAVTLPQDRELDLQHLLIQCEHGLMFLQSLG